jgi:Pyruvate/2-oxoacid:ferredoxin oxidoreductase delta subunit
MMAIAEFSTVGAFAACMSCLLCHGLFSCDPTVFMHDNDAYVQRRYPAGCMLCAQLPLDSQV